MFGNFAFSDTFKNGLSVVVTARNDQTRAQDMANEIAARAWDNRAAINRQMLSMEDAVALALDEDRQPVIYSDAGDNPGGGGEGRTTWLLSALVSAGAKRVLFGSFSDQESAAESHNLGEGAKFDAVFSRTSDTEISKRFSVPAEILALHQGDVVGGLGIYKSRKLNLGLCAALRIGGERGITVTVISFRKQNADPVFFEMFGLDVARAHNGVRKVHGPLSGQVYSLVSTGAGL